MLKRPTPAEVKAARLAAGLTQAQAAALLDVGTRQWEQWEADESRKSHRPMKGRDFRLFQLEVKSLARRSKKTGVKSGSTFTDTPSEGRPA